MSKKQWLSGILLISILMFSACGGENESDSGQEEGSFSYDLTENGCGTGKQEFSKKSEYCSALQDTRKNNGCALSSRKALFSRECNGTFNEVNGRPSSRPQTPSEPAPRPSSAPNPGPTSAPPSQPDDRPEVVKRLEAAGIEVEITRNPGPTLPGQVPFQRKLQDFYRTLALVEGQILAKKYAIARIYVTSYTLYRTGEKTLTLDVGLNSQEVGTYLGLIDRRLDLERSTSIEFDFGIEIYGHETDKFAGILQTLRYFELKKTELAHLNSMVSKIDYADYDHYSQYSQELKLNRNAVDASYQKMKGLLLPLAGPIRTLKNIGFKLEVRNQDFEQNNAQLVRGLQLLERAKADLEYLFLAGAFKVIKMAVYQDKNRRSGDELMPAFSGAAQAELPQVLDAMRIHYHWAKNWSIPIKGFQYDDLDQDYLECVTRLKNNAPAIQAKSKAISEIELDHSSFYSSSNRRLTIGYSGTQAELAKIISDIRVP